MTHHVTEKIALEYLETPRHTLWQHSYTMHKAGAQAMKADALARPWHMWRIALVEVSTGRQIAIVEQGHGGTTCPACDGNGFEYRPNATDRHRKLHRCGTCDGATVTPYREELTPAGPQLVIPGCERRAPDSGKPSQLSLFG